MGGNSAWKVRTGGATVASRARPPGALALAESAPLPSRVPVQEEPALELPTAPDLTPAEAT
jgi:hypothetical protein